MALRLILRLTHPASDIVEWLICDDNTPVEGPFTSSLHELKTKASQYPVIVLVPGIAVHITETSIPRTSRTNLLKAIPYTLEDQIAEGITNTHFAIIDIKEDKQLIAIVARAQMDAWLKQLSEANIFTESIIPDFYGLPDAGTAWYALCDKEKMLCSCGHQLKFVTDKINFYNVMRLYLESEKYGRPSHIEIFCDDLGPLKLPNGAVSIDGAPIHCVPAKTDVLTYLSQHLPTSPSINLLQGDYRPAHTQALIKRTWKIAGVLVLIWWISSLTTDVLTYHQLNKQQKLLQQHIQQIYFQVFPTATTVTAPKVRIERELTNLQNATAGSAMLNLITQVAPVVVENKEISIESLDYKEGELTLKIRSDNFQNIDNLASALKQKKLSVQQGEAQRSANFATSNLVIRKIQ